MAESLTLMEAMQSGAPVGFAFVDTDFRIVQINQTLAEVNGSPAEEQVGKTVAEVVPDVWAQMQPVYERVLSSRRGRGQPRGRAGARHDRRSALVALELLPGPGRGGGDRARRDRHRHHRPQRGRAFPRRGDGHDRRGALRARPERSAEIHEPRRREAARLERRGAVRQVDARGDPLPARRRLSPSRGGVRAVEGEDRAPGGADDARGLHRQGRDDHPRQLLGGTADARDLARRRRGRLPRPQRGAGEGGAGRARARHPRLGRTHPRRLRPGPDGPLFAADRPPRRRPAERGAAAADDRPRAAR